MLNSADANFKYWHFTVLRRAADTGHLATKTNARRRQNEKKKNRQTKSFARWIIHGMHAVHPYIQCCSYIVRCFQALIHFSCSCMAHDGESVTNEWMALLNAHYVKLIFQLWHGMGERENVLLIYSTYFSLNMCMWFIFFNKNKIKRLAILFVFQLNGHPAMQIA